MSLVAGAGTTRRIDVLAALSIAIDLGSVSRPSTCCGPPSSPPGSPTGWGLSREQRDTTFHTTLVMWIGCHADSHEYVRWFGDDIVVKREAYLVDWAGLPYMRFLMGNIAHGAPLPQRSS